MKTVQKGIVRWIITFIWMIFVWRHAHWSVTLTLIGLTIANELQVWQIEQLSALALQLGEREIAKYKETKG